VIVYIGTACDEDEPTPDCDAHPCRHSFCRDPHEAVRLYKASGNYHGWIIRPERVQLEREP